MLEHLHWYFQQDQLWLPWKHIPTLRVVFTGKLALGSNTSPFGPVVSKKSGFLTYPQPPLALKNPCINRSALSCPWKMKTQERDYALLHILYILQLDSCARDLVQPNNLIVTTMWLWKAWRKANYWQLQTKSHLHVKCNHLSAMNPGIHWIIVRRVNPCALWIHPQYILLSEPE